MDNCFYQFVAHSISRTKIIKVQYWEVRSDWTALIAPRFSSADVRWGGKVA